MLCALLIANSSLAQGLVGEMRTLLAGRSFVGEDGYRQVYGELLLSGSEFVMEGLLLRPNGSLLFVIDRVQPAPDSLLIHETTLHGGGSQTLQVRARPGGGIIILPLTKASASSFISRECWLLSERPQVLCVQKWRLPGGGSHIVRYTSG